MSYLSDMLGDFYKEGMTEEEISVALETINSGNKGIDHYKQLLSKANSEASKYKKELRERMSAEEQKKAQIDEELQELRTQNAELIRNAELSKKTAKLLGIGYSEELATETATAMLDGDFDIVIANQSKFVELQKQSAIKQQMQNTPRPNGGDGGAIDYKQKIEQARSSGNFSEMAYYTRLEAQNKTQE